MTQLEDGSNQGMIYLDGLLLSGGVTSLEGLFMYKKLLPFETTLVVQVIFIVYLSLKMMSFGDTLIIEDCPFLDSFLNHPHLKVLT